jgi:RND family efflux transporter MFP subunit
VLIETPTRAHSKCPDGQRAKRRSQRLLGAIRDLRASGRLIVLGATLWLIAGCGADPSGAPRAQAPATHEVPLSRIEQRTQPIIYSVPGSLVPAQRLQVASRISGFIEAVHVDEGDRVETGTPLVDIDEAQVEAMIRAGEAVLASAEAELADAREDVQRYQALARSEVLAEEQLRDARVRSARVGAEVEQARAELDARRQDRRYTRLTSPVRGLVRERLRDPGDLVTAGESILRLDVLGPMELEVFVPTTRVGAVTAGQSVAIEMGSEGESVTGRVISVVHSADAATRRCKVRIALPDASHWAPGQFGCAHLVIGQEPVAVVPQPAVVTRAGIEGVFVVDDNGTARFRSVRLGRRWGTDRELLAGIEAGTVIVLQTPAALRDGDQVRQASNEAP